MYKVLLYKKSNGKSPVGDYLLKLKKSKSKKDREELKKIESYIAILGERGLAIGQPYIKHIREKIWELRPAENRILFAVMVENTFLLLRIFRKKTNKTPKNEIEKALKDMDDFVKGGMNDEKQR